MAGQYSQHGLSQPGQNSAADSYHQLHVHSDNYIGIDVGTGSARACIVDSKGDIIGLASENIGLWQPQQGYYVRYRTLPCPLHPY